jgi:hypothetical protein
MANHHCKEKIGGIADDAAHGRFLFAEAAVVLISKEDRVALR